MKYILSVLMVLFLVNTSYSQRDPISRLRNIIRNINPELSEETSDTDIDFDRYRTPNSEVEDAVIFLSNRYDKNEAQFIRFFSTYAIPNKEERQNCILVLNFVIHSLVGLSDDLFEENAGGIYPLAKINEQGQFEAYNLVPGSETLWWIDLRNYNWTIEAWEEISRGDGYFVKPIVREDNDGILRLLSGNAVLRADWFIKHVTNTTHQLDIGLKQDFYSTLLYAKTKRPNSIEEWRLSWGLDLEKARKLGNEYGVLVSKSRVVTRHNRMLFYYRTELGYLYETYDVLFEQGNRDYVESFFRNAKIGQPPEISDAGEMFATNMIGLQVYGLRDGKGNIVNFGDPTAVRHSNDVLGDVRVRTADSCMDCHASGPIPGENTLVEFLNTYSEIKTYKKEDALRLKRNFLDEKFEESIKDNQSLFSRSLYKVNGLDPNNNGVLFLRCISRYGKPVNIEIAAFECGVTVEEFRKKILETEYRFGARLKLLVTTGETIPREVWESPGKDGIPGGFQQAMIIINGLTTLREEIKNGIEVLKINRSYPVKIKNKEGLIETLDYLDVGDYCVDLKHIWVEGFHWQKVRTRSGAVGYVPYDYFEKAYLTNDEYLGYFEND